MRNSFVSIAGILGALAVMLGAMGAHALKARLGSDQMQVYETAVTYQFYHTLGLLFIGLLMQGNPSVYLKTAGNLFLLGIALFSGSLYFLSLRTLIGLEGMGWVGALTPVGGLSFILGWLFLSYSFYSKKS